MSKVKMNRREALRLGSAATATAALAPFAARRARAQSASARPERFLFVVGAAGGASIVDSFLPVAASEGSGGNAFEDSLILQPNGSNLRCVASLDNSIEGVIGLGNGFPQQNFLQKHYQDMVVMPWEGTSVNHVVAAKRAVTGNNVNAGRTIQEAMAVRHGESLILPNCNMSGGGYLEAGVDEVPTFARAEPIQDPRLFPFSTHGTKGVDGAPSGALLDRARQVRGELEDVGVFSQTFRKSNILRRFNERRATSSQMEGLDLIKKLMLMPSGADAPLQQFGLETSAEGQRLLEKFPTLMTDPYEAQGAMAFLLARYGVSCSVTLSPGNSPIFQGQDTIINAPIAFDWSHRDHRGGQNAMWSRVLRTVDSLIDLLKETDYVDGDPSQGKMWDRSLVYVATEFGRDKVASGGSGHNLNNGSLMISPLLKGNRVYGGVDPNTCLTYGFDPVTGDPRPNEKFAEGDVYSAIAHALDIDFAGRTDFPSMVRGA
jgi:hypothetical protein